MTTVMDEMIIPFHSAEYEHSQKGILVLRAGDINVSAGLGSNAPRGEIVTKASDRDSVAIASK